MGKNTDAFQTSHHQRDSRQEMLISIYRWYILHFIWCRWWIGGFQCLFKFQKAHHKTFSTVGNLFHSLIFLLRKLSIWQLVSTEKGQDRNKLIHFSSYHPPGLEKGLPYSQLLRTRRICSTDKAFVEQHAYVYNCFKIRGYDGKLVHWCLDKVKKGSGGDGDRPFNLIPNCIYQYSRIYCILINILFYTEGGFSYLSDTDEAFNSTTNDKSKHEQSKHIITPMKTESIAGLHSF